MVTLTKYFRQYRILYIQRDYHHQKLIMSTKCAIQQQNIHKYASKLDRTIDSARGVPLSDFTVDTKGKKNLLCV